MLVYGSNQCLVYIRISQDARFHISVRNIDLWVVEAERLRSYLGKCAGQPDIGITEYHCHDETEGEEDNGVGVEAKIVLAIVDTTTVESLGGG
jgi:hypothetical protein